MIGFYGGAGSSKNFILRAIFEGWRRSIVRHNITQSIWNTQISGENYIDFEIGKELATVKIINGEVIHSPAIYRLSSIDIRVKNTQRIACCCIISGYRVICIILE